MAVITQELTPDLWPMFEKLFGEKGACGGCWCMSCRVPNGEKWKDLQGEKAKQRIHVLITSGKAHGILAFADNEPIGWCSFDRRLDFPKLQRARSLACDDADRVWSIPCFFVRKDYRGKGVAAILLAAALKALKKHGAAIIEGYPIKSPRDGSLLPSAFAWTGTGSLFSSAGFTVVGNPNGSKQRVRRKV